MKKTATSRPLSLRRETVRVLAASHLSSVQGGLVGGGLLTGLTDNPSVLLDCIHIPRIPETTLSNMPGGNCGTFPILRTSGLINP